MGLLGVIESTDVITTAGDRAHARALSVYVLSAIRIRTVALAIVSLNNALLLKSLS